MRRLLVSMVEVTIIDKKRHPSNVECLLVYNKEFSFLEFNRDCL